MVATEILGLHSLVWEILLKTQLQGVDLIEFSKKVTRLRIALSCSVCGQLLINKDALSPTGCRKHFACKACLGKQRDGSKKCHKCDDWDTYVEDETLTEIIHSYQDFCLYFLTSEHVLRVLEIKHEVDPKFDTFQLIDLIKEGLKGFSRTKKRKIKGFAVSAQSKCVLPIEVPKKSKQRESGVSASAPDKTSVVPEVEPVAQPLRNEKDVTYAKKPPTKKANSESLHEKPLKSKGKSTFDEPPIPKVYTPIPAKPTLISGKNVAKSQTCASTSSTVTTAAPKPAEPVKAASSSPPLVTIKVEVQTTPEKSQSPHDGNESSSSSSSLSAPDPLQLQESLIEALQSPLKVTPTIPKPPLPNVTFPSNAPISGSVAAGPTLSYKISTQPPIISSQPSMAPQIIQIAHPSGMRTLSIRPQHIRLTGLPNRIPVQIIGPAPAGAVPTGETLRGPIITNAQTGPQTTATAPAVKRRIIFTTATPHDLQKWPDTNKVIQFATGDLSRFPALSGMRPSLISVGQTSGPVTTIRTSTSSTTVRPLPTATIPLVRPPSTHVLNASSSPMGPSGFTSNSNQQGTMINAPFVRAVAPLVGTSSGPMGPIVQSQPHVFATSSSSATTVTNQVPESSPSATSPLPVKRKPEGCRCGNATPTPGKLTCIGQRCACYADRSACSDCKCKGCKNPYVPGGQKLLQGVRALIDPQTNQTIPVIATPLNHAPSSSTLLSANPGASVASTNPLVSVGPGSTFGTMQSGSSSMPQPVPPFQFIPVRFGPSGAPQYLQIANPQALHQMPIILSASGHMQGNSSTGITIQGIPVSGFSSTTAHQVAQIQQQQQQQQQRAHQINIKTEGRSQQE